MLTFTSVIALNEVMKYKARERLIDESLELDNNELLENVDRLNRIVESQICDLKRLDDIVKIYDQDLRSLQA